MDSVDELRTIISFLTAMNRRQNIYYRGQGSIFDSDPDHKYGHTVRPALFREIWNCPGPDAALGGRTRKVFFSSDDKRQVAFGRLAELHLVVAEKAKEIGLPRHDTVFGIRESTWAILQHYDLWPTPLVDITSSLHLAVCFALDFGRRNEGYVYVVGLPELHGSVTHHMDQQLVVADLRRICPPSAKRPHRQDGLLVGRHPFYGFKLGDGNDEHQRNDLAQRTIAVIRLNNKTGGFQSVLQANPRETILEPDDLGRVLLNVFLGRAEWDCLL